MELKFKELPVMTKWKYEREEHVSWCLLQTLVTFSKGDKNPFLAEYKFSHCLGKVRQLKAGEYMVEEN